MEPIWSGLLHRSTRAWLAFFAFSLGTTNDHASIVRESWVPESLPPPLTLAETDGGPLRGPFLFWFQRGLVIATAFRRQQERSKSVSEPHLSLIDRPRPSEGRFKKSFYFQWVDVIGRASFSKVQPIAQFVAKPEDGRRAVDVGGKRSEGSAA